MEIKVIKVNSFDELKEALKTIHEEECSECKKDAERGREEAEARYDQYIDLLIDYCKCVVEAGEFSKDVEMFREYLHNEPLESKRMFFKNFSSMSKEIVSDIMELTSDYAFVHDLKKTISKGKEKAEKNKESIQTKITKENSNFEEK